MLFWGLLTENRKAPPDPQGAPEHGNDPRPSVLCGMPEIVFAILVVGLAVSLRSVVFPRPVERSRSAVLNLLIDRHGSVVQQARSSTCSSSPMMWRGSLWLRRRWPRNTNMTRRLRSTRSCRVMGASGSSLANYGIAKRYESSGPALAGGDALQGGPAT